MPTSKTPGPKPDYLVVEDHLKCQTAEGEVSLDLRVPIARLELFMDMEEIDEKKMPRYIRENILWPDDRKRIEELRDGAKALEILMKYAEAVGQRMGASLGELQGSTDASEDTGEPSATTSATASA